MSPRQQPYHVHTEGSLQNEVNFNICPHTNTKWKTRCKLVKITLRMGFLGYCCYTTFQKFNGMHASPYTKN